MTRPDANETYHHGAAIRRARHSDRQTPGRWARARGMSVIEVLIAASLLLVISLGILALLTRSMANTNRGWEATVASNIVRTELDDRLAQELTSPELTLAAGQTELTDTAFFATGIRDIVNDDDEGWYDDESLANGLVLAEREQTVRQFNVKQLLGNSQGWNTYGNGDFIFEIPKTRLDAVALDGSIQSEFVHVKSVRVVLEGRREGGPLGAGQRLLSETLKSF